MYVTVYNIPYSHYNLYSTSIAAWSWECNYWSITNLFRATTCSIVRGELSLIELRCSFKVSSRLWSERGKLGRKISIFRLLVVSNRVSAVSFLDTASGYNLKHHNTLAWWHPAWHAIIHVILVTTTTPGGATFLSSSAENNSSSCCRSMELLKSFWDHSLQPALAT